MMPGMMPPGMGGMGMGMGMGYPGMGMPGMGMPGMMPGMGMPGMGMPGMMPGMDPMALYEEVLNRVATGLVASRVRTRALLELLEAKGVFAAGEFDAHADAVWARDFDGLTKELLTVEPDLTQEAAAPAAPMPATAGLSAKEYAEAMVQNLVNEAVAGRVRLRAVLDLLEAKGIFGPGEFEAKADQIWDRDYEELTMDFYRMKY